MIAVDTNILVYAHRADSPWHTPASQAVRELAESGIAWAIPWPCVHEFAAIVTHPKIYRPPTPIAAAVDQIEAWLASPRVVLLSEGPTHFAGLQSILIATQVVGAQIHDARVAALCIDHGVRELWTADRDFSRFPGLNVRNPLLS